MSFAQVVGHKTAVKILQHALKERRLGVSYLFYGPSGLGKSFVAKQFAKSLNCQNQGIDACDKCSSCRRAEKLEYPDLYWLDFEAGSENIKIEQVRAMQNAINLRPFEGRAKVFVINNCQGLTEEAANCLLKVIEEPPLNSLIILITADVHRVLPTIASRCQKIRFINLKKKEVKEILSINQKLDAKTSRYLSLYSDGRIGDCLRLSENGFLSRKDSILDAFLHTSSRMRLDNLFKDKDQAREVLSILLGWFRDLLLAKVNASSEYLINQDRIAELKRQAQRYTHAQLLLVLNSLAKSFEYLKQNINLRLVADTIGMSIWKE